MNAQQLISALEYKHGIVDSLGRCKSWCLDLDRNNRVRIVSKKPENLLPLVRKKSFGVENATAEPITKEQVVDINDFLSRFGGADDPR